MALSADAIRLEIMTAEEYDRDDEPIPELMSLAQAALPHAHRA